MPESAKILVVDDEVKTCFIIKRFLEGEQYLVDVAHNLVGALLKLYKFRPQVVILDVGMPGLSGDNLIELIEVCGLEMQIIMVSAVEDIKVKEECLRRGVLEWISKPIQYDHLNQVINKALQESI